MAVLPMRKISICGLKKERKGILELLQSSGVVELTEPDLEECGLENRRGEEALEAAWQQKAVWYQEDKARQEAEIAAEE